MDEERENAVGDLGMRKAGRGGGLPWNRVAWKEELGASLQITCHNRHLEIASKAASQLCNVVCLRCKQQATER